MSFVDEKVLREIDDANRHVYSSRNTSPNESMVTATQLLERSRALGYRRGEGLALRTIAAITVKMNPKETLSLVTEAIEILTEVGDLEAVCAAKMSLFCYYHHIGHYLQSFNILKEAFEEAVRCGNNYIATMALYNMGVSSEEREDFSQAVLYYEQCMQNADKEISMSNYWGAFAAVARIKSLSDDSDEIMRDLQIAAKEVAKLGLISTACDIHTSLATCYSKRGLMREATVEMRIGRQLASRSNNEPALATMLLDWGAILRSSGQDKRALRTFKRALAYAQRTQYLMIETRVHERLAETYKHAEHYKESVEHLYEYTRLKETLQSKQLENRMQDLQAFHKVEMAAKELERANQRSDELAAINEELHIALEQQAHLQRELMRLASTDDLTGALNRRQVLNDGILEMERYRHMGAPFSVTLIDIDFFKAINDSFGHATGDEILRRLTASCSKLIRKFDVFGRLGGEEFCIIHHDTDTQGAISAVERLMESIQSIDVTDILGDRKLTVSMGICEVHKSHVTFYDVLHSADMALYEAKNAGRNTFRTRNSHQLSIAA